MQEEENPLLYQLLLLECRTMLVRGMVNDLDGYTEIAAKIPASTGTLASRRPDITWKEVCMP